MNTRLKLGRNATVLIVLVLGAVMVVRVTQTYSVFNATYDEESHLTAGLFICATVMQGTDALQPVLSTLALGALPCASGARPAPSWPEPLLAVPDPGRVWPDNKPADGVLGNPAFYWRTLTLARMGNLLFVPLLVYFVYRWSFEVLGPASAIAAVAITTMSPTVLALAGLATVDFGVTAALLVAAFYVYRWVTVPGLSSAVKAGLAAGFALMSKHSAVGYLPLIVAGSFVLAGGTRRRTLDTSGDFCLREAVQQLGMFVGAGFLFIWAIYGFQVGPVSDPQYIFRQTVERLVSPHQGVQHAALENVEEVSLPAPAFFDGLAVGAMLARNGSPSYLLGETKRPGGWWYYFPVAASVKLTIPFLLLIAIGWFSGGRAVRPLLAYPALAAISVLGVGMLSTLNVGIRHVLPMFPFLAIVASTAFCPFSRGKKSAMMAIAGILLVWHGWESLRAHPDYLAYFNQLGRGREHRILSDSNLDWGQDLARLAKYVESEGIGPIHLAYFGTSTPRAVGLNDYVVLQAEDRPHGWVAVSVTHLQGVYLEEQHDYRWLLEHEPTARVGKSIWVYHLE